MLSLKAVPIVMLGALAFVGCSRPEDTTKTTTQTETKQVGTTSQSTSETKVATPFGDTKSVTNTYLGTVTVFKPGERIEVMTGNKEMHGFDLNLKNDVIMIDSGVAIGSKVQLVEEKGEQGFHRITVNIAASE